MDPNTLFQAITEHTAAVGDFFVDGENDSAVEQGLELAQEVLDMHGWLCDGGFRPQGMGAAWSHGPAHSDALRRANAIIKRADSGRDVSADSVRRFTAAARKLI